VKLKPVAVLTGAFDAALNPDVSAFLLTGGPFRGSAIDKPPLPGDRIVAVIVHSTAIDRDEWSNSIERKDVPFFPSLTPNSHAGLIETKGLDDARVAETAKNLRNLGACMRFGGQDLVSFLPLITLTGNFDAACAAEIETETHFGDKSAIRERPRVGAKALVLQKRDEAGKYSIPDTPVDYFPADDHGNHPAYFEVLFFDNEDVDKTIENLRVLRSKDREALQKKDAEEKAHESTQRKGPAKK
jgi:hypothetical protein